MRQDNEKPAARSGVGFKLASGQIPADVFGVDGVLGGVEGAWAHSASWRDGASGTRWLGGVLGLGLGALACLALAGVTVRALSRSAPEDSCNSAESCNALGATYAQASASEPEALVTANRLFQRSCDLGHAAACNNLGLAYQTGEGVARDYTRAMSLFERACSRGLAEACSNQGALYEHGLGVPANLGDAQRAYAQACRHGSALGCSNLGVLYSQGRGVVSNDDRAVRLFAEACAAGSDVGCNNLVQSDTPPANVPTNAH